jgi:intracellular sulfur oxidation DsrE/DsrF family protein
MRNYIFKSIARILLTMTLGLGIFSFSCIASAQSKVVYHIDDAQAQGLKGLRNIRNHLDTAPQTKIIVVTHALGVDLLLEGAKDQKNNIEYGPLVSALKSRGVTFEVCEITLKNRNLNKDQFILDADFTPSGVVRIADLQYVDRFAYIKP